MKYTNQKTEIWKQKQKTKNDPTENCLQTTQTKFNHIGKSKVKGWKKIYNVNIHFKNTEVLYIINKA